jgi:hypothetical protein
MVNKIDLTKLYEGRLNKANGQINVNPSIKNMPEDLKKLLKINPKSIKWLVKPIKVGNG